ncbi:Cof-type HAD-IIB family hydrolase [Paenibacillus sp. GCM10023252]|uniref:Cof-type HAD-IIB family hydrolase n=1 Tax=Paenibacillus sp. GCM10023252 TaxID=3252649 RepID=UPI0036098581
MNYDLIALDVDGTLLSDHHVLTQRTRDAVREAAERGAEIVLCTGRGPGSALPVLEQLGLSGTLITHNGAATIDAASRSILHQYEVAAEQLDAFISYSRVKRVHFDVNTAFEMLVEGMTAEAKEMYERFLIRPELRLQHDPLPTGLVKFTVFGSKEDMDDVEQDWGRLTSSLSTIRSGDFFIDVQHPDASKGKALEQLVRLRGLNPQRVMAIGNYYNDISMLQYAGTGIAMGNSPDLVKESAQYVSLSNEEDGVEHALREYAFA